MQKYWSGTVTRNTVMRRAADYLDLIKPNIAALDYTAAVRICGALNLQIHTSFSSGPNRNVTTVCRKITFFGVCVDRSQSLFYFVPQESHSQAFVRASDMLQDQISSQGSIGAASRQTIWI